MKKVSLAVVRMPNANYKVYAMGQPNDHYTDWAGCNFRRATLPGQPRCGFTALKDAVAFKVQADAEESHWVKWARDKNGSHVGDYSNYTEVSPGSAAYKTACEALDSATPATGERLAERENALRAALAQCAEWTPEQWRHVRRALPAVRLTANEVLVDIIWGGSR